MIWELRREHKIGLLIDIANLSRHPNFSQATDMLEKAFAKIPNNMNLIIYSDQGWQYQHKHYQKNA